VKVSIGANLQEGPWGGGNQFVRSLTTYLQARNIEVSFDLSSTDLDIILLIEPRKNLQISAYSIPQITNYIKKQNKQAIVVHRINECDERKGTKNVNKIIRYANFYADQTVFISKWIQELYFGQGMRPAKWDVIYNGADTSYFNGDGLLRWEKSKKIKFVTHHWGGGWLKGFDIYEKLDKMLGDNNYQDKIEFTYIGNVPDGFRFNHAKHIPPLNGKELASAIKQNHVYLTASQNEPAGMHHIEGACCGLPLLYRESGALTEYCSGFGVGFIENNFESKLIQIMNTYDKWVEKIVDYPNTSDKMCKEYHNLFLELVNDKKEILDRRIWHKKWLQFQNKLNRYFGKLAF